MTVYILFFMKDGLTPFAVCVKIEHKNLWVYMKIIVIYIM